MGMGRPCRVPFSKFKLRVHLNSYFHVGLDDPIHDRPFGWPSGAMANTLKTIEMGVYAKMSRLKEQYGRLIGICVDRCRFYWLDDNWMYLELLDDDTAASLRAQGFEAHHRIYCRWPHYYGCEDATP